MKQDNRKYKDGRKGSSENDQSNPVQCVLLCDAMRYARISYETSIALSHVHKSVVVLLLLLSLVLLLCL